MFREIFLQTLQHYTPDERVQAALWKDLQKRYFEPHRHYHNLHHLNALAEALRTVEDRIHHWPAVMLAVAYHDVIYDVGKQDNEAQSAVHVKRQLHAIVPAEVLQACSGLILATKSHTRSEDSDTNYFTDADLSVLGASPERYRKYCADIRSEYSIYPDVLYRPGRQKVLQHFLEMKQIFKTPEFYERYEEAANANLTAEIAALELISYE